jgi:hypothetical protein
MKKLVLVSGVIAGMATGIFLWTGCNTNAPQDITMQTSTEQERDAAACTFYFTRQPANQTIDCGTTSWINFSVATAGSTPAQYQWYYNYDNGSNWYLCNSKYFTGGTTANLSYAPQSPIYTYCQVRANCGTVIKSAVAKLTIRSLTISRQPADQSDRCGYIDMKTFTVGASGSASGYSYEWFYSQNSNGPWQTCINDKYFTGGNTANLVAYPVDTRYLKCEVSACGGTVTTRVAKFTVCWQ